MDGNNKYTLRELKLEQGALVQVTDKRARFEKCEAGWSKELGACGCRRRAERTRQIVG